ncbi:MAG: exopolysaccharide biosynthesis polyprenyl glycosylphosphotransferase [Hyphomonadaceae bacterium]
MSSLVNIVRRKARSDTASQRISPASNPLQVDWAINGLIVADVLAGVAGTIFALQVSNLDFFAMQVVDALPHMLIPLSGSIGVYALGGYNKSYSASIVRPQLRASGGAAIGLVLLAMLIATTSAALPVIMPALILTWGLISTLHLVFAYGLTRLYKARRFMRKLVLIGATPNAERLIAESENGSNFQILGVFDDRASRRPTAGEQPTLLGQTLLGKIDDLLNWKQLPQVDQIVITVTSNATERVKMLIERLRVLPQQVILLIDLDSFNPEAGNLVNMSRSPAAYVSGRPSSLRRRAVKRMTDIVLSIILIMAFSPVMLVCAILIKLEDGGPILFRQRRHGFQNELIRIWKLRSMRPDPDAEDTMNAQTMVDDPRVTRIGKFIRRSSLDELPQLFNVLSGEMSLVGPRPHAVGMTAEATQVHDIVMEYSHRHRVKPGITGWAQINGSRGPVHSHAEVRERVRLDIEYLNTASFLFDLYILLMTAPCLLGDSLKDR